MLAALGQKEVGGRGHHEISRGDDLGDLRRREAEELDAGGRHLGDVVRELGPDVERARALVRARGPDGARLCGAADGHDDRVRAESKSDRGGHRGVLRVGGGDADEPVTEAVEGTQGPTEGSRGVQTLAEAVDQDDRGRTHGPRRLVAPVGQDRAHERRVPPEQFPERIGAILVRGAVEAARGPIVRGVDPLLVDGRRGTLHHHHQIGSDPDEPHAEALVQRSRRVVAQEGAGHLAVLRAECRKVGDELGQLCARLLVDAQPRLEPGSQRAVTVGRRGEQRVIEPDLHAQLRHIEHGDVEVELQQMVPRLAGRLLELDGDDEALVRPQACAPAFPPCGARAAGRTDSGHRSEGTESVGAP